MTEKRRTDDIDEQLARMLDAEPAPRPLRPMWPEVERRRARARGFQPDLALATAAAITVGFLVGALTFNGEVSAPVDATNGDTMAALADWPDAGPTLDQLYLMDEGELERRDSP